MAEQKSVRVSTTELVAILAMLMATTAFSIDAMLPVLPDIASDVSAENPNKVQLVVATFLIGMGVGTLFTGPLSDAYGRRAIALGGAVIYCAAAICAALAPNVETLLVARLVQGLGAAGPRVIALALTRDLFSGREMARVISLVMMVFALVPVIAPTLGAGIAWMFGWRMIFVSFVVFSVISVSWLWLRQPETLPVEKRRPFRLTEILSGIREIVSYKQVVLTITAQSLLYAMLFVALMTSQPIFEQVFGRGPSFPLWFGLCAAISASASLINAAIVIRLGMRTVVLRSLAVQILTSVVFLGVLVLSESYGNAVFAVFFVWMISVFFMAGLGIGNLNAIAMEPVGHMAGLAASIISASATVIGALAAVPVSLMFDGTPMPALLGSMTAAIICFALVQSLETQETIDAPID